MTDTITITPAGRTPWGDKALAATRTSDAIVEAGLDWGVDKVQMFDQFGREFPRHRGMVRGDNGFPLGVVGKNYEPVQNVEAFAFLDDLVGEGGIETFVAAGAWKGGRKIFIQAKLPGEIAVRGTDKAHKYLTIVNAHDGSSAFRVIPAAFRLWCSNQLRALFRATRGLSIRHTQGAKTALADAKKALKVAGGVFTEYEALANELARRSLNVAQFVEFLDALYPSKEDAKGNVSMRTENIRGEITNLFEGAGMGLRGTAVAGTAYAALQALVEFGNYHRSTRGTEAERQLNRFETTMVGSGAGLVDRGVAALTEITGIANA